MLYPFFISSLAGLSTAIGALLVIGAKKIDDSRMGFSQGFAAGVMLAVSLLDILPHSFSGYFEYMNTANALKSVLSLFVTGWVMGAALVSIAVPDRQNFTDKKTAAGKMAIITTLVMVFHNMPEGVLTFFTSTADKTSGLKMALAVALHNIPEGMAIAAPVLHVTSSRKKAFLRALAAGMAEPAAGLMAYVFLHRYMSAAFLNGMMPTVAGIMCQAAICRLIPDSARISNFKHTFCGIITGIIAMSIGLLLF